MNRKPIANRRLTDAQRREYAEVGYLVIENLLPDEEFAELDRMVDALLDGKLRPTLEHEGKVPDSFYTFWEPGMEKRDDLPRRQRVRLMSWIGYHDPYFWGIDAHPAIAGVAAELFDSAVQLFSDTVFMKPAGHGIAAELHQDTAFWPKLRPNAINFWMAVDKATVENGCLHIIPGSHHEDLPHTKDPVMGWVLREDQTDISKQVPLELPPNAGVFMDSALMHRSYPNHSDRDRRAMTSVYLSSRVEHVEPWNLEYRFKPIALEPIGAS